jgi:hypothetical protein
MAKNGVISGDVRARGMNSTLSAPIWMAQVLEAPAVESRRQAHGRATAALLPRAIEAGMRPFLAGASAPA